MSSFYMYSAADIGLSDTFANWLASPSSTVSGSASTDLLEMSDNDLLLENEGGGSDQILTEDLYIDGVLVGSIGDTVINLGQSTITNATTGEVGYLVVIQINGVAVGYASTIELNPGDDISMSAWAGTSDEIAYDELEPSCFARGTRILTKKGEVKIEHLHVGDMVWTRDAGFQPLRWVGTQTCKANGRFAPVMIKSGALGNARDLTVSPKHRMLISGWRAQLLFGVTEVLCHACDLVNNKSIFRIAQPNVVYFHMMFDAHQIIKSESCLSESFHPFRADLDGFGSETRAELLAIFPELGAQQRGWQDARPTLTAEESMLLQLP